MRFTVLGPVAIVVDGEPHGVPRARARGLLALLLLDAGRPVSAEAAIEALWGPSFPASAPAQVQAAVHAIRQRLAELGVPETVSSGRFGYRMDAAREQIDVGRFEQQVRLGREAGGQDRPVDAQRHLRAALALWQGEPLADAAGAFVATARARLVERRLAVMEDLADVELGLGHQRAVATELAPLVDLHPTRERLRARLALALYRDSRRSEALEVIRDYRQLLAEREGLDPGDELSDLETAILRGDASLTEPRATAQSGYPPATQPVGPAQLPADVPAFTGRTAHLRQLDARLAESADRASAVVISAIGGTAGVGKTALAVHWAHGVRGRFPDGQLYVDLRGHAQAAPVRPIEALSGFLHALGVPAEQVPVDVEEAAGLFRSRLADQRVLILLDNAHSPEQVRPLLPGTPGCLVLITSRNRLTGLVARDGARRLALDPLSPAEARELLGRLLGADRVDQDPAAAAELARICGYLPLALRIAAANLGDDPTRGLDRYVADLSGGDRLTSLAVTGDEQTAVRAAFDLSYTGADPAARRLFRLFGAAPVTDLTAESAGALTGSPARESHRVLDRLVAAHLVVPRADGRFGLHDLLRLYAAERAGLDESEADRAEARHRLLDWYRGSIDAAARLLYPTLLRLPLPPAASAATFPTATAALAWLDAEQANLVTAIRETAAAGPHRFTWQLVDALRGYFLMRRYTIDWLAVGQAGLAAAEATGDLDAQAAIHLTLGDAYVSRSRYAEAIEQVSRARALFEQTGWPEGLSAALGNLGNVCRRAGRLRDAADHLSQALLVDTSRGKISTLLNLASVCVSLGRLAEASDHLAEALELSRGHGSRGFEAITLGISGESYLAQGRYAEADSRLTEALTLFREVGDRRGEHEALRLLAEVHRDAGRYTEAADLAHAVLAWTREAGERRAEADALNTLASVDRARGEYPSALDHHQRAGEFARELDAGQPEVVALVGLAAVHRLLGRPDDAVAGVDRALTLARQAGYRVLEGQALTERAMLHCGRMGTEDAQRALDIHRETGHRLGEGRAQVALGHAQADTTAARHHWALALALFEEIGAADAADVRALLGKPVDNVPRCG